MLIVIAILRFNKSKKVEVISWYQPNSRIFSEAQNFAVNGCPFEIVVGSGASFADRGAKLSCSSITSSSNGSSFISKDWFELSSKICKECLNSEKILK